MKNQFGRKDGSTGGSWNYMINLIGSETFMYTCPSGNLELWI